MVAVSPCRLILLFVFSCLGASWLSFLARCPKLEAKLKLWGLRKFGKHSFCFVMVLFLSSFCEPESPGSAQWRWGGSTHHWGLFPFEVSSLYSFLDLKLQRNYSRSLYPGVACLKRPQHSISQMYYFPSCGKDHQNWSRMIRKRAETLGSFGSPGPHMSFGSCSLSGAG